MDGINSPDLPQGDGLRNRRTVESIGEQGIVVGPELECAEVNFAFLFPIFDSWVSVEIELRELVVDREEAVSAGQGPIDHRAVFAQSVTTAERSHETRVQRYRIGSELYVVAGTRNVPVANQSGAIGGDDVADQLDRCARLAEDHGSSRQVDQRTEGKLAEAATQQE